MHPDNSFDPAPGDIAGTGEIVGIAIWCDNCKKSHEIKPEQLVLLAVKFPDHPLVEKLGQGLLSLAMAMAMAAGLLGKGINSDTSSGFIPPYSPRDMEDFLKKFNFKNYHG